MRRKYFGLAMAAVATLGPAQAFGGDREIAQSIMKRLEVSRDAGELKDYSLDMKVDEGVVLFRGTVAAAAQRELVLATSKGIEGVRDVVDELEVSTPQLAAARPAKIYKPKVNMAVATPAETAQRDDNGFDFANALAGMEQVPAAATITPATEDMESVAKVSLAQASPVVMPAPMVTPPTMPEPLEVMAAPAAPAFAVQEVVPGIVMPTAAYDGEELDVSAPAPIVSAAQPTFEAPVAARPQLNDQQLTAAVVRAIGRAQAEGHLKDFGVDVNAYDGVIELTGSAASPQQREFLEMIANHAPGAQGVRNMIQVASSNDARNQVPTRPVAHRSGTPTMAAQSQQSAGGLQPIQSMPHMQMQRQMHAGVPARPAAYDGGMGYSGQMINGERVVPGSIVNHGPTGDSYGGQIGGGAPMMGQPVPMGPAAAVGAPRYDSPNLPNYAWPGYAAHPNYAALSYPQQYSPSAFPFIGPFYPYPQVPLGWRKVSLEWDDGWWFLDFTDK